MKPRIVKDIAQPKREPRDGMDTKHLANVRQCLCVCCGKSHLVHAHHLLRAEGRGLSRKTADKWAIPLCLPCHEMLHRRGDEEAYLAERGIDGRAVASALWAARGEVPRMQAAAFKAHQAATLRLKANA